MHVMDNLKYVEGFQVFVFIMSWNMDTATSRYWWQSRKLEWKMVGCQDWIVFGDVHTLFTAGAYMAVVSTRYSWIVIKIIDP